jgi:hypothetical protein
MLHNPGVIGGSWLQDKTKLVALLVFDPNRVVVKIKESSIKDTKQKVPKLEDIQDAIKAKTSFQNVKGLREMFHYKNIIPVPHALVKLYLSLKHYDPSSVAKAFYSTMTSNEQEHPPSPVQQLNTPNIENDSDQEDGKIYIQHRR